MTHKVYVQYTLFCLDQQMQYFNAIVGYKQFTIPGLDQQMQYFNAIVGYKQFTLQTNILQSSEASKKYMAGNGNRFYASNTFTRVNVALLVVCLNEYVLNKFCCYVTKIYIFAIVKLL